LGGAIAALGLAPAGIITRESLVALKARWVSDGEVKAKNAPTASDRRLDVLAGGLAVLEALMELLGFDQLSICDSALREGVLIEMAGNGEAQTSRQATIDRMLAMAALDRRHAAAVATSAAHLLQHAKGPWALDQQRWHDILLSAAELHEVGLSIARTRHAVHGHYLLLHTDMVGFSQNEQRAIALLVRYQRGGVDRKAIMEAGFNASEFLPLLVVLRVAIALNAGRSRVAIRPVKIEANGGELTLHFELGWGSAHPLTRAALYEEGKALEKISYSLAVVDE
ncbi:hypothetical protein OAS86_04770, partial [Gammaproteobacteria bacterium]|nr:hypothetical protein [Gammaproteobacteria bacterium]